MALVDIAIEILRIVLITFIFLGTIGNSLNLFIFTRPALSTSSCTQYLLAASIDNIIVIYTSLLTRLLANGYGIDIARTSTVACKLRFYVGYVFFALSPYFYVLACFDRYCSSSAIATRRSLCNKKVANKLIIGAIILASILYSHMAIFYELLRSSTGLTCNARPGAYNIFYRIFYLVVYCFLPSLCMGLLCVLTLLNIRTQAKRIQPRVANRSDGYRRIDRQMMRMLFAQILSQLACILPFAIHSLVGLFVDTRSSLYAFFLQILTLPLFVSYTTSFYIFTISSQIYRKELLKLVWCRKLKRDDREFSLRTLAIGANTLTRGKAVISTSLD